MISVVILGIVTLAYAGYNLLIKVSGMHAAPTASTTILATFSLQAGAVLASTTFFAFLLAQGGHAFRLTTPAYMYAFAAGVCIGIAEIGYFYLFGGIAGIRPLAANVAIPVIVTGSIVLTLLVSWLLLQELLTVSQIAGAVLVAVGIVLIFLGNRGAAL